MAGSRRVANIPVIVARKKGQIVAYLISASQKAGVGVPVAS
jgi:hypothetical protein